MEQIIDEWKPTKTDIATEIQSNIQAEATAIQDYDCLLRNLRKSDLSKTQIAFIESEVAEIIGDELNHQDRLKRLYSAVSGIKENKE